MKRRKLVKYEKNYLITIKGQTDTTYRDDKPFGLETSEKYLKMIVEVMDNSFKNRTVELKEL